MNIRSQVIEIFKHVFDNDQLVITDTTSSKDIDEWDSLANVDLIVAMENTFAIKFKMSEIMALQNVGDMIRLIETYLKNK